MSSPSVASFDYIVIGAGSAGCTLAARLTENGKFSVLLLEAGGTDRHPEVLDPVRWTSLFPGPLDWGYQSQPISACDLRVDHVPRAKMLGGCHSHNASVWVRGHQNDYDGWLRSGCPGWGWDDVLPVFQRIENWQGALGNSRRTGGPMYIAHPVDPHPLAVAFAGAGPLIGLPANADHNDGTLEGTAFFNLTIRNGQRFTVVDGYLNPALARDNLTVMTGAQTTRLLLNGTRCTGVETLRSGVVQSITARREVILSAGVIGSAQCLLSSGIGPAADLRALGIPVVVDLPGVGRNYQDHVLFAGINYECAKPLPPARNNGAEATLWWRSRPGLDCPDIQPVLLEFPFFTPELAARVPSANGFAIAPSIVKPQSRGRLQLVSSDPLVAPQIDVNFLSCDADLDAMLAAVELCRELGASSAFAEFEGREVLPGALSRTEMLATIRQAATSYFHPVGTCRMGTGSDCVVSPTLAVHGVEQLRVVDASIMPEIPCVNTNGPSVMIAEKAADWILA
ncbi:MAG: GMC family oxidoreductase N-terminal domain-containing protein [Planctomycetaceae bacterium]|nr:GMC family oxidoreductase N-terminal domain-containing protein [Planctomycetaceae bacterium]